VTGALPCSEGGRGTFSHIIYLHGAAALHTATTT
jgi:hypothetical protein